MNIKHWNFFQKLAFRYLFTYCFLYIFPFPLSETPVLAVVAYPWNSFATTLVGLVSAYCFNISPDWSHTNSGCGDQMIRWIELATYAGLSLLIAIVWSCIDRNRKSYSRLFTFLRVWSMFFVSSNMLGYGAAKMIPSQFPPLQEHRLLERIGDLSPMGLLWTFMSGSAPYTIFTGIAETATGVLLAIPSTMTLGALLGIAVSLQIVMLNMCYDVPVKILSSHLLLLSFIIASPEFPKLFKGFFLGKAISWRSFRMPLLFRSWKLNLGLWLYIWLFLLLHFGTGLKHSLKLLNWFTATSKTVALSGTWTITALDADSGLDRSYFQQWQYLGDSAQEYFFVRLKSGKEVWFKRSFSNDGKQVDLDAGGRSYWKMHFNIERADDDHVVLKLRSSGGLYSLYCERLKRSDFRLLNRGFHWVNEYPYNR